MERNVSHGFYGSIINFCEKVIPVYAVYEYDDADITTINVDLILLDAKEKHQKLHKLIRDQFGSRMIIQDERGVHFVIEQMKNLKQGEGKVNIDVGSMTYGMEECVIEDPESVSIIAKISPSGIVSTEISRISHSDGNVEVDRLTDHTIEWNSDIGIFDVRKSYEHFTGQEKERKIYISVEYSKLYLDLPTETGKFDINAVREIIPEYFEHICTILSFCFRQPVWLYEIKYMISQGHDKPIMTPNKRTTFHKNLSLLPHEPLIDSRNLCRGGFHDLMEKYWKTPIRDGIKNSIQFLASSHNRTLEESYFLAFSALDSITEIVISQIGFDTSIPKTDWKKIEKSLRNSLNSVNSVNYIYVNRIKNKLPELRRMSFADKLLIVVDHLKIDVIDLWTKDGLSEGVMKSSQIRNNLFHMSNVQSYSALFDSMIRIRHLTERIILRCLDWPKDKLWMLHDLSLVNVNNNEKTD